MSKDAVQETFALARRGLPLAGRERGTLRGGWLPTAARRPALAAQVPVPMPASPVAGTMPSPGAEPWWAEAAEWVPREQAIDPPVVRQSPSTAGAVPVTAPIAGLAADTAAAVPVQDPTGHPVAEMPPQVDASPARLVHTHGVFGPGSSDAQAVPSLEGGIPPRHRAAPPVPMAAAQSLPATDTARPSADPPTEAPPSRTSPPRHGTRVAAEVEAMPAGPSASPAFDAPPRPTGTQADHPSGPAAHAMPAQAAAAPGAVVPRAPEHAPPQRPASPRNAPPTLTERQPMGEPGPRPVLARVVPPTDIADLLAPRPQRPPELSIDRISVTVQAAPAAAPAAAAAPATAAAAPRGSPAHSYRNPWSGYHARRD
jgi:hypothetical protein